MAGAMKVFFIFACLEENSLIISLFLSWKDYFDIDWHRRKEWKPLSKKRKLSRIISVTRE